jgi:hypothetical protein
MRGVAAGILALGLVACAGIVSNAFLNRHDHQNTLAVTGLGKLDFEADLVTWSVSVTGFGSTRQEAYAAVSDARKAVESYLNAKGFAPESYLVGAARINERTEAQFNNGNFVGNRIMGYEIEQTISMESDKLTEVEVVSRGVSELMNQGIQLYSASPQYFYSKLSDLKIQLIDAATADARKRAEHMAAEAGAELGSLHSARLGVFQITGRNANEDFSWGGAYNTGSRLKTASVTARLEYGVE